MSRAAGRAPIRPTTASSGARRELERARLCAFGMTRRAGRSAANDPGLAALFQSGAEVITLVGKSSPRQVELLGAALDENLRMIEESVAEAGRRVAGGDLRRRALLRRLRRRRRLRARLPRRGRERRGALDRALRHQWRLPAARDRPRGRAGEPAGAARAARHPYPQRYRERGRQQPGRGPGRRPPGSGYLERPRRALRQRQSGRPDPDADAQDGLRDRGRRGRASPSDRAVAGSGRAAEPHSRPPRGLCRRERLRPQGRPACLRGGQGPEQLRAHRARDRRQPAPYRGLGPGGSREPSDPSRRDRARRRAGRGRDPSPAA